jgi:hypothetical protein
MRSLDISRVDSSLPGILFIYGCIGDIIYTSAEDAMRLRIKIGLVLAVLGITFGLGRCGRTAANGPKSAIPAVLPANDSEQITVDPSTHQLIILRPNGKRIVETLPDRPSTIDILKNGTVNVTSKQLGFEYHLFMGLIGSDHVRLGIGMDAFYWKKLDLGIGVADQIGMYPPVAFAKVTYNIKGNLQAGLVYQSNQYIGGVLAVRIF